MATLQAIRVVKEEEGMMESPRSPEARLGMKVEDLWDIQGAQLSPTEKLNACFEGIPVSAFPSSPSSQVVEIRSNASLKEAVEILAKHKILSAPIVDVNAPEDASWMERYTGIVEFAGIVVWILCQSEPPSPRKPRLDSAFTSSMGHRSFGPEPASHTPGTYFQSLISSQIYNNTTVEEITGSFRWGPFLALQKEDTFLTMLLLLSKYKMKSVPVIDSGRVDHIVTQSAVIHMLAECAGLHWFEDWGTKKLSELGLPLMTPDRMVKVHEDEPVLQAFKVMRERGIGGVPVVDASGTKAVGNISLRDIQLLLMTPEIYHDFRSVTAKGFLKGSREYIKKKKKQEEEEGLGDMMITCHRDATMKELIVKLDTEKIHRTYVVDSEGNPEGVVTLRDIISKLVHEPRGYFGDFFDGVLPLPQNCRV